MPIKRLLFFCCKKGKKEEEKPTKPISWFRNNLAKTLATTSKQLVWVYTANSIIWIWCSYILAFMDKIQIAETLSSTVCTIIIGQIGFYLVTSTVENVFKYNDLFGPRMCYDANKNEQFEPQTFTCDDTITCEEVTTNVTEHINVPSQPSAPAVPTVEPPTVTACEPATASTPAVADYIEYDPSIETVG